MIKNKFENLFSDFGEKQFKSARVELKRLELCNKDTNQPTSHIDRKQNTLPTQPPPSPKSGWSAVSSVNLNHPDQNMAHLVNAQYQEYYQQLLSNDRAESKMVQPKILLNTNTYKKNNFIDNRDVNPQVPSHLFMKSQSTKPMPPQKPSAFLVFDEKIQLASRTKLESSMSKEKTKGVTIGQLKTQVKQHIQQNQKDHRNSSRQDSDISIPNKKIGWTPEDSIQIDSYQEKANNSSLDNQQNINKLILKNVQEELTQFENSSIQNSIENLSNKHSIHKHSIHNHKNNNNPSIFGVFDNTKIILNKKNPQSIDQSPPDVIINQPDHSQDDLPFIPIGYNKKKVGSSDARHINIRKLPIEHICESHSSSQKHIQKQLSHNKESSGNQPIILSSQKDQKQWKYVVSSIREIEGEQWIYIQNVLSGKNRKLLINMQAPNQSHAVGQVTGLVFIHDNMGKLQIMQNPFQDRDSSRTKLKSIMSIGLPDKRKNPSMWVHELNQEYSLVLLVGGYFQNMIGSQQVPINEALVIVVSHCEYHAIGHAFCKIMLKFTRITPLITTVSSTDRRYLMIFGGQPLKHFSMVSSSKMAELISIQDLVKKSTELFNSGPAVDYKRKLQVDMLTLSLKMPFSENKLKNAVLCELQIKGQKVKAALSAKAGWMVMPPDWQQKKILILPLNLPKVFQQGSLCNSMGRTLVNTFYFYQPKGTSVQHMDLPSAKLSSSCTCQLF